LDIPSKKLNSKPYDKPSDMPRTDDSLLKDISPLTYYISSLQSQYYKSRTCTHNGNDIPMESGSFGHSNGTSFALWGHLVERFRPHKIATSKAFLAIL
jgi:hypothetical protein